MPNRETPISPREIIGRVRRLDRDLRRIATCPKCGKPVIGVGVPEKVGLCVCGRDKKD